MNDGWVKLFRQFKEWEWYSDVPVKTLFIHLLLSVNHAPQKWRGETIRKGETVTSIAGLAEECGLSVQQVRSALAKLEKTGEIERRATNKNTVVKVVKFSVYQAQPSDEQQTNNKQITNKQQSNNNQITTNKNEKNEKNDKNIYKGVYGEYKNVRLTEDEYKKLTEKGLARYIDILSEGKKWKGYKYNSDYLAILKWAREDEAKKKDGTEIRVENLTPPDTVPYFIYRTDIAREQKHIFWWRVAALIMAGALIITNWYWIWWRNQYKEETYTKFVCWPYLFT